MDLTQISGVGATGALVIFLGYLLTHMSKDRSLRLEDAKGYDDRIDRLEARLEKVEAELDRETTLRRKAEEEANNLRIRLSNEEAKTQRLERQLNDGKP